MDYRKIIFYVVIILLAVGYWYTTKNKSEEITLKSELFAQVYAGTRVVGELYRNEPERFFRARDSIYAAHNFNADSVRFFQQSLENDSEKWPEIWGRIRNLTDSLTTYYIENPVIHPTVDSTDTLNTDK
ncbi:MAG: hypothetical protein V3V99_13480 [candidate division Zixibacteria bacterium]